jgi:hypothetical protein
MRYSRPPSRHDLAHRIPHLPLDMHDILHHVFLHRPPSELTLRFLLLAIRYALQLQQPIRVLVSVRHKSRQAIELRMPRRVGVIVRLLRVPRIDAIQRHEEGEELRRGDGGLLYDGGELEGQVCGAHVRGRDQQIDVLCQNAGVVWPCRGTDLEDGYSKQAEVAPVRPVFKEAEGICADEYDE